MVRANAMRKVYATPYLFELHPDTNEIWGRTYLTYPECILQLYMSPDISYGISSGYFRIQLDTRKKQLDTFG